MVTGEAISAMFQGDIVGVYKVIVILLHRHEQSQSLNYIKDHNIPFGNDVLNVYILVKYLSLETNSSSIPSIQNN